MDQNFIHCISIIGLWNLLYGIFSFNLIGQFLSSFRQLQFVVSAATNDTLTIDKNTDEHR